MYTVDMSELMKRVKNAKKRIISDSTSKASAYNDTCKKFASNWPCKDPYAYDTLKSSSTTSKFKKSKSDCSPVKKDVHDVPKGEANRSKIPLQVVRGLPVPAKYPKQFVEEAMDWVAKKDDVIIVTFCDASREWLKSLVLKICSWSESSGLAYRDLTLKIIPQLEKTGTRVLECLYEPRIYMHHLPYDKTQREEGAKCIYMYVNPRDAFGVAYHAECKASGKWQNVNHVFDRFLKGEGMPYGSYLDHVMSYVKSGNENDVLLLPFENLMANGREEILRIAKFIDPHFCCYLMVSEDTVNDLVRHANATYVKYIGNVTTLATRKRWRTPGRDSQEYDGAQREIFGEGKRLLSEEQQRRLKQVAIEMVRDADLLKEWYCPKKCAHYDRLLL